MQIKYKIVLTYGVFRLPYTKILSFKIVYGDSDEHLITDLDYISWVILQVPKKRYAWVIFGLGDY